MASSVFASDVSRETDDFRRWALAIHLSDAGRDAVLNPWLLLGLFVDVFNTVIALLIAMSMSLVIGLAFAIWAPESHKGATR